MTFASDDRPMPKGWAEFYGIAKRDRLSFPGGRALYACNRLQNGWPRTDDGMNPRSPLEVLRSTRESTAKRWIKHWQSGGCIKVIGRSREEYLAVRRERDRRRRAHYKAIGA